MTILNATTCATDLHDTMANSLLTGQGYTIRHIETWHRDDHSDNIIVWDNPAITEADLAY